MTESASLAEVFLGFGGKTMYAVGTCLTSSATVYGVHEMTGLAIKMITNLPRWLKTDRVQDDNTPVVTRKQLWDHLTSYGRISLLIMIGIGIKMLGHRMGLDSTIQTFNQMLGYTVKQITH
jgi:hypothetical protein